MNNDLISRSELKKAIEQGEGFSWDSLGKDDLCVRKKYIDNAPTVNITALCPVDFPTIDDPYPCCSYKRPQGEWIKWNFNTFGAMGDWEYKCSNCEKVYGGEYNFCPNCGADMRGKEE